jgi:hypothetical protein
MLSVLFNHLDNSWGEFNGTHEICGGADSTELTISSLPAWLRKFEVETSLLSILYTRGNMSSTFGLFGPRGNPIYVNG